MNAHGTIAPADPPSVASRGLHAASVLLAIVSLSLSLYLTWASARGGGVAGCAPGSGCDAVLGSRWSRVAGIPVAALSALLYAAVLAGLAVARPSRRGEPATAWMALLFLGAAAAGAAAWFMAVQAIALDAFCPYCVTLHVIGLLMAGLIAAQAPVRWWWLEGVEPLPTATEPAREEPEGAPPSIAAAPPAMREADRERLSPRPPGIGPGFATTMVILGLAAAALLALGQWSIRPPTHRVAVLDGRIQLVREMYPMLGDRDAERVVVYLYDYTCPHCRVTHDYLVRAIEHFDGRVGAIMAPMPLELRGNTNEVHRGGAELARLAVAVWRADPSQFEAFDRWLFEHDMPPTPAEAAAKAEELVGAAALQKAIDSKFPEQAVDANVRLYGSEAIGRHPLSILIAGNILLVGRPATYEEFLKGIEDGLGLSEHESAVRIAPSHEEASGPAAEAAG